MPNQYDKKMREEFKSHLGPKKAPADMVSKTLRMMENKALDENDLRTRLSAIDENYIVSKKANRLFSRAKVITISAVLAAILLAVALSVVLITSRNKAVNTPPVVATDNPRIYVLNARYTDDDELTSGGRMYQYPQGGQYTNNQDMPF